MLFYRRLLILDMNRVVKSGEKDLHLKEKVQAESDYAIHMVTSAIRCSAIPSTTKLPALSPARHFTLHRSPSSIRSPENP